MGLTFLLLDFDGEIPERFYSRAVTYCQKLWGWTVEGMRIDRTRHGYHVVIAIAEKVSPVAVVAAQAILGSDRKREAFGLMRVLRLSQMPAFWRKNRWNVLYSVHRRGVKVA